MLRIIDEKGRLFGKINVIDFLVILFLLCLLPLFYFGYKVFTKNPRMTEEKELIQTEIDYLFIKVSPEVEKIVSIGDRELDGNEQVIGEIISLGQSSPYKYEFDIGGGQKIIKEDLALKQIETELKLTAEVKEEKLYYKDWEIKVNSPIEFKTKRYILTAIPFKKEEEGEKRIIDLNATLKDLDEDTLKKISVGDKDLDKNNDTIAEILSLGKIESSYTSFNLGSGNVVKGEDTGKQQISTRMRLKCQVRDGNQLYFRGKKVAHNTSFEFKTDKYTIIGLTAEDYKANRKEKWISIQVKFSRVVSEIAEVVRKGDTEKDAFGRTTARISSITSNEPALVTAVDAFEDKFLTLRHPFDKDITASMDVLCIEKEGDYYFKDNLAKMGNNITFSTDLYTITGLIVGKKAK